MACCSLPRSAAALLLLLICCNSSTTGQQDSRGAGAGTLSSLVRALELSGQESVQSPTSRSLPPPRSRNLPPSATGSSSSSRSFLPTSQSRFSPSAPPPSSPRRESPPQSRFEPSQPTRFESSKPTRFESSQPTRFESSQPTRFEAKPNSPKTSASPSPSSRPVATSKTEFRFGSNRSPPSSRITFIPQDRGQKFNRPLLPHQEAAARAASGKSDKSPKASRFDPRVTQRTPPPTTSRPSTTPEPEVIVPEVSSVNKETADEYLYDDYYDDYYYYDDKTQGNDSEKKGNRPEDLGPIDPPMTKGPLEQSTTEGTTAKKPVTESTPVLRFTTSATRTTKPSQRANRFSLFERLAGLGNEAETKETQQPSNELQSSRDGRLLPEPSEPPTPPPVTERQTTSTSPSTTTTTTTTTESTTSTTQTTPSTTTESRVEVRVTNTTESTFVVANIQTSRSMSMRHEDSSDNTTPIVDAEPTPQGREERLLDVNEETLDTAAPQPSLTALFENIDISFNESNDEAGESAAGSSKPLSKVKVIDITTEAEKLSTTEKVDISAFFDDIFTKPKSIDPSLLPPGFSLKEETTTREEQKPTTLAKKLEKSTTVAVSSTTPKSNDELTSEKTNMSVAPESSTVAPTKEELLLAAIFGKSKTATAPPALLPPGFTQPPATEKEESSPSSAPKFNVPVGKTESNVPAHLLPKGFNASPSSSTSNAPETTVSTTTPPSDESEFGTSKGPRGLIFPKRKNRPSFLTTPASTTEYVAPSGPELLRPSIVNIFDRIKTTPKLVVAPVTKAPTPKQFEELIAAMESSSSTSSTTSTTTTTTTPVPTTTLPPRPTTPGVCGEKCRLAATLRIVEGADWVPELANRDTKEWQVLAKSVTNELNAVYQRSRLNRWFVGVEIDSFSKGSVLVDYFLQLNDVSTGLDTVDLKQMMNEMLESSNRADYSLGPLKVDPEGTDFVVMKERHRSVIRDDGSYLIPEWLIAVIVISLASFLFIIIFGITVLVSRARINRRNVPLTEEVLNKLNANQLAGVDNYSHDSVYDMEAIWNEKLGDRSMKPPSSRGRGYNPNYNINIYDSWRTDWSGPYGSSATYAKRRPEANFGHEEPVPRGRYAGPDDF